MFSHQLIIYLRASINPLIIDMPAYLKRGKEMRQTALALVSVLTDPFVIKVTLSFIGILY